MTGDDNNSIIDDLIELGDVLHFQFPDEHGKRVWASLVLHSCLYKEPELYCPRCYITSATRLCGKSQLLTLTSKLVNKGVKIAIPTASAMFTAITQDHPTLCIDEISRFYEKDKEDTAEVTGILLEGADPDGSEVPRVNMNGPKRVVEYFETYGPVFMAGTDRGNIPDDILDRSIEIRLRRRAGPKPPRVNRKRRKEFLRLTKDKIEAFVARMKSRIDEVLQPIIPIELDNDATDRFIDKWETLFVINDLVDLETVPVVPVGSVGSACSAVPPPIGINGHKIRQAAIEYLKREQDEVEDETEHKILIIHHFQDMFDKHGVVYKNHKYLLPDTAVKLLRSIENAPWSEYNNGDGISVKSGLKGLLNKGHKIKQHKVRTPNPTWVYLEDDFKEAFKSYPRPPREQAEHTEHMGQDGTERYKPPFIEPFKVPVPYTSKSERW